MTSPMNSQVAGTIHPRGAKEAALIATFYGQRGQVQSLRDHLVQSLVLTPQGHNSYTNEGTNTFLYSFDPASPSAHDTTVIQLALNTPGTVVTAWRAMREQLEAVLPHDVDVQAVWGYTLMYQAELVQDPPADGALGELLPGVRGLHSDRSESPQPLAQADLPGGRLWLIDIPLQGDGLQAATVYIALSKPHTHNRLVQDVLYNPNAALLMVDLIAQKGYYQMRQYRLGDLNEQYRKKMETLLKHSDKLLQNLTRLTASTDELDVLAREYGLLMSAIAHLHELRVGLERQELNFRWWCERADGSDVVAYHQRELETASRELELLVTEGQHPLEAARTAVEMTRAQWDKEQERKQQRIETILTAAAAVLSVLVFIDKDAARALLQFVGIPMGVPHPNEILFALGLQFVFIVIATLIAALTIRWIRVKRPR